MEDVQNRADERGITIDRVGVSDLCYPIIVLDRRRETQRTVAQFTMSVRLPCAQKGTHMSRFIEVLERHRGEVTMRTLPVILVELKQRLAADSARVEVRFPYFLERAAPVSGATALMGYACTFVGESDDAGDDFVLGVRAPVTSLCPCSKAISDYGAHNQRGYVQLDVRLSRDEKGTAFVWIEELIDIIERSASAPVYPLLKREDERHVTMQAYDKPAFVEDVVRDVANQLRNDSRIAWFRVHVVNHESIHDHNAFAQLEWSRR